jgi:hypothetical protein
MSGDYGLQKWALKTTTLRPSDHRTRPEISIDPWSMIHVPFFTFMDHGSWTMDQLRSNST